MYMKNMEKGNCLIYNDNKCNVNKVVKLGYLHLCTKDKSGGDIWKYRGTLLVLAYNFRVFVKFHYDKDFSLCEF